MAATEALAQLTLEFDSVDALKKELDSNLRKGRAFAAGTTGLDERAPCEVVLVHPESGSAHTVRAEVVWVKREKPGLGIGVQFQDFDGEACARIEAFVNGEDAQTKSEDARSEDLRRPRHVHERVRAMSVREQQITARQGNMTERIALERAYGGSVWEVLLQSPNLTIPEVARISKKGSLPKPLVNTIVANNAWLASPEVQRALLSNPRVGGRHLDKVLRAMSQVDLQRIAQQTAYRPQVRSAAKKLLKK